MSKVKYIVKSGYSLESPRRIASAGDLMQGDRFLLEQWDDPEVGQSRSMNTGG